MTDPWIFPDWPAPSPVHAAVTTRHGPGMSAPPFERFNLGRSTGDSVEAVDANRGALRQALALPAAPRWLRQVHGADVAELGPLPSPDAPQADAAASACFAPTRPGHWRCDLAALARRQLTAAGVTRIHGGGFDTFTDPRLYSYRRDGGGSGRFASLVWLDP